MKISYKVLKKYIKDIKTEQEIASDLVMHTAEVEEIIYEWKNLEKVFIWEVMTCEKHPEAEKLNCTTVKVKGETFPIVCGASNVKTWIKVPVAITWAQLAPDFTIAKTKIRWEVSEWMICSEDELWLIDERQEGILELPKDAPLDICVRDYFNKNDAILEIDNKAINHRPDLFSHIWIIREICAINKTKFDFEYENLDFSNLSNLWIENKIPKNVSRYIWLKIENVSNIKSPDYIKQVLSSAEVNSKWLLVDISNYCLYLYGQPTHCFDAAKIDWNISIRFAIQWEKFTALNDSEYELNSDDIVIADNSWVIALWWIIGWKYSAVSDDTKNIIVESAHFDQAIIRKTWKKLWIRTDALNVFEKDLVNWIQKAWVSLIATELQKNIKWLKLTAYSDCYLEKQKEIFIDFNLEYINNLIWKQYSENEVMEILKNLWIEKEENKLKIPFWRKDLNYKADIAEEIARIDWYDNIEATIPRINTWAVIQDNTYKIKNLTREYFCNIGYYDMYTYSFVNNSLMEKTLWDTQNLVTMKNALSEELTHLRWSLIPNLLLSLEKNIREYPSMKLFELEKVFNKKDSNVLEYYSLAWVEISNEKIPYYNIQKTISDYFEHIWINKFFYEIPKIMPKFAHGWRTASIMVRGKEIWTIWEIHPKVANNFEINSKIAYFEINAVSLSQAMWEIIKAKDISLFQENNFDLNFVIDKTTKASKIMTAIEKSDSKLITKVELVDIYENEEKLAWKRSLTYKIFIQSMESTLDDKIKGELITTITNKVSKVWWELR